MYIAKIILVQNLLLLIGSDGNHYNRGKKYEIKKNYIDIYTNHPYTSDVIDSYRNTDFYKYPQNNKYTIHRSDDNNYDDDRYVYPPSKFSKDIKDVLHSDFGIFETETVNKLNNNNNNFNNNVNKRRKNDTKNNNNYNFVFDDEKNLVYVQPIEDDYNAESNSINHNNNNNYYGNDDDHGTVDFNADDEKKKFVYLESQKHVIPNVGVHLAKRPNFQTSTNGIRDDIEEPPFNYQYPRPIRNQKNLFDNKSKFNEILRRYVTKVNGANHHNNQESIGNVYSQIGNIYSQNVPSPSAAPVIDNDVKIDDVIKDDLAERDKSKFLEVPLHQLKTKTLNFANKLFSLFTIVQFPNSRCVANSSVSSPYEGTCYHPTECIKLNGTAMGYCAKGFGVCCVFRGTCGGSSDKNCTYFESPNYPNYYPSGPMVLPPNVNLTTTTPAPGLTPDPRIKYDNFLSRFKRQSNIPDTLSCIFRIYKNNPDIQQMRIDFIDFELNGPTNGTCTDERLIISGFNINSIPILCGYNTGQHVYVDVSGLVGPLQLQVVANTIQRKRFKIRICQYGASCTGSMGCLQYYTGVSGVISSFNYDKAAIYSRSDPSYFNNLNYAICIRREPGYCSVTYTNVNNGLVYPFELVNFINGVMTVPIGEAGVEIFNCPNDYIVLNGLRLCGYRLNDGSTVTNFSLNAPVTDTSGGPIVIPVRSNGMNVGRGFRLFYMQNRCPT